jgi:tetratricopeptide (TPR) repeat protein
LAAGILRRAGIIACLFVFGGCTQVALMSVTPMVAAVARHVDQRTSREIVELEQKQDWDGLLALARSQLEREPVRAEWWWLQGYALARQGHHAAAVESYLEAVRISPEDEISWLALGQSQSELGRPDLAIQAYRRALSYRPESAQVYLALADLYQQQGKPELALPNYREAVRYEPDLAQAWHGLALSYHLLGQAERRDAALLGLRKLDPAAADAFEKIYLSK